MEVPKYLQVLWNSKWLILVGIIVAAIAAFFAGYTIDDGQVESRAEQTYTSGTTILVNSTTQPLFQAVIPGQALTEGQSAPEDVDLTSKAILYAYLISGLDMRTQVEGRTGEFSETDSLTALRRTTQPGGDESFAGRYTLPILEVVGTSTDPARAVLISRTAAESFQQRVLDEQNTAQIPEADRVLLTTLDEKPAVAKEGSNPAIPVVVTFLGVFLLFVAAAYIIAGAKAARDRKRAAKAAAAAAAGTEVAPSKATSTTSEVSPLEDADLDLTSAKPRSRRRPRSPAGFEADSNEDVDTPEPVKSN